MRKPVIFLLVFALLLLSIPAQASDAPPMAEEPAEELSEDPAEESEALDLQQESQSELASSIDAFDNSQPDAPSAEAAILAEILEALEAIGKTEDLPALDEQDPAAAIDANEADPLEDELLPDDLSEVVPYVVGEDVVITLVEIFDIIGSVGDLISELQTTMDGVDDNIIAGIEGMEHPLLITSFEDYSVTEGLLLLLLLYFFSRSCITIIKEGFTWLR